MSVHYARKLFTAKDAKERKGKQIRGQGLLY